MKAENTMTMILDGKKISSEIRAEVRSGVQRFRAERGRAPGLAFITVGEDPASLAYVGMKERACGEVGIYSQQMSFPASAGEKQLLDVIGGLNVDSKVDGILVQLPLPAGIDRHNVLSAISPAKDVDGFHPVNMGKLLLGLKALCPCTPRGIMELVLRSGLRWEGSDVVIVGRSDIVGKPLAALLIQRQGGANATVTLCHTGTRDLASHTRRADILVAAMGKPHFINSDMVRKGAVVIDVGVKRVEDASSPRGYRMLGDVDFDSVAPKSSAISPNPGGVGPMTIAMLLSNTLQAAMSLP